MTTEVQYLCPFGPFTYSCHLLWREVNKFV